MILTNAGYSTCSIARSVEAALSIIEKEKPDLVLIDIFLQGEGTGIDLGNDAGPDVGRDLCRAIGQATSRSFGLHYRVARGADALRHSGQPGAGRGRGRPALLQHPYAAAVVRGHRPVSSIQQQKA